MSEMRESLNIYCDESCHLERDCSKVMVLGAICCKTDRAAAIARRIRDIKGKHDKKPGFEAKWSKISPAKLQMYLDLVEFFFDESELRFRAVIIPDKSMLNHEKRGQDHDTWYYKMCFLLLEPMIVPELNHQIYLDIKDTRSEEKRKKLEQVLRNSRSDGDGQIIEKVQQIRSHESELMQLADLFIGAICYHNRKLTTSQAKLEVIRSIQKYSKKSLEETTWLQEPKVNILMWQAGDC